MRIIKSVKFNTSLARSTFILTILFSFLSACGGNKKNLDSYFNDSSNVARVDDNNNNNNSETNTPDGTLPVPPELKDYFAVTLPDSTRFLNHFHEEGSNDSGCKISKDSPNRDIDCLLEVSEGDIYAQGLQWHVTAPAKVCDYVRFENYFYYNFESGFGPSNLKFKLTKDSQGKISSLSCVIDGVSYSDCRKGAQDLGQNGYNSEIYFDEAGAPHCIYDHSESSSYLPNCCFGHRTITSEVVTQNSSGTTSTINIDKGDWGGSYETCLGGPAIVDAAWPKSITGFPLSTLTETYTNGFNYTYEIKAPLDSVSSGGGDNFSIANYYQGSVGGVSSPHRHEAAMENPFNTRVSDLPYAVDPISDRSLTSLRSGNGSFRFSCLDSAHEVLYAINLYVREWNTLTEFLAYINSPSAEKVKPDEGQNGKEGSACEYYTPNGQFTEFCNDRSDWDDTLNVSKFFPQELFN